MNHHIILRFRNQLAIFSSRNRTTAATPILHDGRQEYSSDMVGFGRFRVD